MQRIVGNQAILRMLRTEPEDHQLGASEDLAHIHEALRSPWRPLDAATRAFFEPRFGQGFGDVRVHTDPTAARSAQAANARAYTIGRDVVLGKGQHSRGPSANRRLLAHELAHVVQQGRDGARGPGRNTDAGPEVARTSEVRREPLPCFSQHVVDIFAVSLPGSSRSVAADVAKANSIFCQCGVAFRLVGGESWETSLLDSEAPKKSLNEYSCVTKPTAEETAMLEHRPGGEGAIYAYYVPRMSDGNRGESFWPGVNPLVPRAVVVADSAAADTFAHELGHILFDVVLHHGDPDNLMAAGTVRNAGVGELEQSQCDQLKL